MRIARGLARGSTLASRSRVALDDVLHDAAVHGVPDPAIERIRRVVTQARLWPGESAEVAAELVAHFEDGLEAGVPDDKLLDSFGDADAAGLLIGRAKRRQRPAAWHVLRYTLRGVGALAGVLLLVYATSAASLYLQTPANHATAAPASPERSAARARDAWALATPVSRQLMEDADELLAAIKVCRRDGDGDGFIARVTSLFAITDTLRAQHSVAGDLTAGLIEAKAASALSDAIRVGGVVPPDASVALLEATLARPARLEGVRLSMAVLLDEMYTRDNEGRGHLTGAGIAVLRELKQWHQPTTTDRFMEPAWYVFPASRQRVRARCEGLCELAEEAYRRSAGVGGVTQAMEPLSTSLVECLRFPAISAVQHELLTVLVANERAGQARRDAVHAIAEGKRQQPHSPRS